MSLGLSGRVTSSQTHEGAFGSMPTIQATNDQAAEKSNILDNYLDYIYGYLANLSFKFDSKIFKKC